jgi:hypothetical protein
MQIQGIHQEVELHGVTQQANGFSIAMNAKAFKVLSSTIYQNKIGSIVRELSANALDAHKMAGCPDMAFYMHLPDQFEPYFVVKDYGTGIHPDKISSVFTVYFNSTKDQSNDTIGAFGLGSKTPFSYTDQFTVTNIFDGFKYIYSAFVSANGQPSLVLLADPTETTEHNGLEINMSVKSEDYRTFANEAQDQLKFLKVKPVVENAPSGFEIKNDLDSAVVLAETAGFILYQQSGYPIYIVQGQIGYPLDITQLPNTHESTRFLNHLHNFGTIRMDFPIGSIGVTASREAVEYTKETVETILLHVENAKNALQASYMQKQQSIDNNWELACTANSADMFSLGAGFSTLFKQNQVLPVKKFANSDWSFSLPPGYTATIKQYYGRKSEGNTVIQAFSGAEIYICAEDCKYKIKRMKAVFENIKPSTNYIAIIRVKDSSELKAITEALGGNTQIKNLANIEVAASTYVRASYKRSHLWKFNGMEYVKDWFKVTDSLEDTLNDSSYVVSIGPRFELSSENSRLIAKFYNLYQALGISPDVVVYAVREKDYDDAMEEYDAKPLKELVDQLQKTAVDVYSKRQLASTVRNAAELLNNVKNILSRTSCKASDIGPELEKLLYTSERLINNYRCKTPNCRNRYYLSRVIQDDSNKYQPMLDKFKEKVKNAIKRYPALKISVYELEKLTIDEVKALLKVKI